MPSPALISILPKRRFSVSWNGFAHAALAKSNRRRDMIKRLLIGAVLGVVGKKLYDQGKLDPYIAKAKATLLEQGLTDKDTPIRRASETGAT
jgi:hypothetical protein